MHTPATVTDVVYWGALVLTGIGSSEDSRPGVRMVPSLRRWTVPMRHGALSVSGGQMVDSFAARFEQLRSRRDELLAWLTKRQQRRYECRHQQRHPVRYTQSDGRQVAREQCRACGHLGRALPLRALPPLEALPPVDDARLLRGLGYTWSYPDLRRAFTARYSARFGRLYTAYLESAEWAEKRRLVLRSAAGRCAGCHRVRALEVHHTTYSHIGAELLYQLIALCRECHSRTHYREVA